MNVGNFYYGAGTQIAKREKERTKKDLDDGLSTKKITSYLIKK